MKLDTGSLRVTGKALAAWHEAFSLSNWLCSRGAELERVLDCAKGHSLVADSSSEIADCSQQVHHMQDRSVERYMPAAVDQLAKPDDASGDPSCDERIACFISFTHSFAGEVRVLQLVMCPQPLCIAGLKTKRADALCI